MALSPLLNNYIAIEFFEKIEIMRNLFFKINEINKIYLFLKLKFI